MSTLIHKYTGAIINGARAIRRTAKAIDAAQPPPKPRKPQKPRPVSESQQKCLEAIIALTEDGIPPSYQEIAVHLKCNANNVYELVERLEKAGAIRRVRRGGKTVNRGIVVL